MIRFVDSTTKNKNMNHFYKTIFLAITMILNFGLVKAQEYTFPENQKNGLSITSSNSQSIQLSFEINQFTLVDKELNGESLKSIAFGMPLIPGEEGAPDMPFVIKNILIPNDAQPELIIKSSNNEIIENLIISPAEKIPFDSQLPIPAVKGEQYTKNEMYPLLPVQTKQTEIRGMQFLQIAIAPFQHNAVTGELLVHKNIEIEIKLNSSSEVYGEDRFRSSFWDPILSDLTFNSSDIPKIDYNTRNANSKDLGCDYLIVTLDNEDFIAWADTIKKFRNEQGIHTKVMTISEIGGNDIQNINSFFEDVYNTWDPVPAGVLLMADYGTGDDGITSISFSHPYEGTYISDNYYADVTNNTLPDFVFARLVGRNDEELELLVHKFINYEQNPPTLPSFYNKPITALGWQTERWFQICSETVGGYMLNVLGKSPRRINAIYEGNPNVDPWSTANNTSSVMNYFGPNGLNYLPATPGELGEWFGGTPQDIIAAINEGAFILQHRDHGFYSGWGEPAFQSNHINQLTNVDLLTHVFSINCQTGQFDVGDNSFGEKFLRHQNGGALSVTAPSQVSYSFVNDALVWGIYDNMWPEFMPDYGGNAVPERDFRPAFGLASGKYFLWSTNWANNSMKIITYRLFHHHGDAFNIVYTEVPMENIVSFNPGITSAVTEIEVNAEEGSLVGLSVDGEFLNAGYIEDGMAQITIAPQDPGTIIKVVVTKQNYYRYEGEILVVPEEGAYIMPVSFVIHDENNNGIVEYNEQVILDCTIKNVGLEAANNVQISLTTSDEFVSITTADQNIGSISSGEQILIEQAFIFETDVMTPDLHQIEFNFSANDDENEWNSQQKYTVFAPNLEFSVIQFEETEGNGNGFLDPGETALASFTTTNTGHVEFPAGVSSLTTNSSYIDFNIPSESFESIATNESLTTEFEITTSSSSPTSSIASITNILSADPFNIEKDLYFNIGLVVEDWETEDFSKFNWTTNGDLGWQIADDYVEEGNFSAKSGEILDDENSILELNYDLIADHEISFHVQISCDEDNDFLHFYIDDELISSWTGLVLFEQFTFPVSAGEHTFKWEYIKDATGTSGLDAAWLDFIILPPGNTIIGTESMNVSNHSSLFNIYPNPASDLLNIKSFIDTGILEYSIMNANGKFIEQGKMIGNKSINTSTYANGLYLIKIFSANGDYETLSFMKM